MTKEELAKMCIDSYISGMKSAISILQETINNMGKDHERMREFMVADMLKKMESKS